MALLVWFRIPINEFFTIRKIAAVSLFTDCGPGCALSGFV
jgi:hypothetical protein